MHELLSVKVIHSTHPLTYFPLESILLLHTKLYFSLLFNMAIVETEFSNVLRQNDFYQAMQRTSVNVGILLLTAKSRQSKENHSYIIQLFLQHH